MPVRARYRALIAAAERLAASFERSNLHRLVTEAALELSGADYAILRIQSADSLDIVATSGIDPMTAERLPGMSVHDPFIDSVLSRGRPFVCDDTSLLPPGAWTDRFAGLLSVRGDVLIPLTHAGRFLGTLGVATSEPRHWSEDDVEILAALGGHAGLALRNADLFDRLEARAARMAVVQAASARMNSATTVEAVGRAIVEEVGAIVDYHNARVYIIEQDESILPIAFEGKVGEYEIVDWSVLRTRVGEGFTGWVALHGSPLNVPNANDDPRGVQIEGTPVVPESMLVVPMHHDGAVVGVITLSKLGFNQFDDDDLQMLSILADQAATGLESARLLSETEFMARELRRLLEMSQELSLTLDPKQVGAVVARHITAALEMDASVISSWDRDRDVIISQGEFPDRGIVEHHPEYGLADYPQTRRVLEQQATVIIDSEDPSADPHEIELLREQGYRLLVMIPLVAKGQAVGILELFSKDLGPTDEARLAAARTMANEAAMALENAHLYEVARSLADRDPLTGFFNHRYLYERMAEEVVRARRGRRPLSLVILDVDDFKLVNDTFGHQFGDRCLVHLADVVKSTLRASDVPARYGGDEFAVILPDTDPEAAQAVARRIAEHLARQPVMTDGRGPVPISVSIGVASLSPKVRTPTDLVEAADAQMYAAKIEAQANDVDVPRQESLALG
ncbi:MAG: diguanylate cyclase [Chloroflexi bacterium]|nr:diguanylate cyclase [Chloroflexota bacterium]